jgi:hypothetical protein
VEEAVRITMAGEGLAIAQVCVGIHDADLAADADTPDDPGDDEVADTFPAAGEED